MTSEVKHRRGTTSQCDAMTPAEGELIYDTTLKQLRIGDGSTLGGLKIPTSLNPIFTGILDLSGASSGQVKFPATQNASSDPNVLDDYEEGTWTASITAATPGDLSVSYTTRLGDYVKVGGLTSLSWLIQTSAFTHTTASGQLFISGVPFQNNMASGLNVPGALGWGGITKASYTDACAVLNAGVTTGIAILACASALTPSAVVITDCPTGGTVRLRGHLSYRS